MIYIHVSIDGILWSSEEMNLFVEAPFTICCDLARTLVAFNSERTPVEHRWQIILDSRS